MRRRRVEGLPVGPGTLMAECNGDAALVRQVQAAVRANAGRDSLMNSDDRLDVADEAIAAIRAQTPPEQLLLIAMQDAIRDALVEGMDPWADGTRPPLWRDALVAMAMRYDTDEGRTRLGETISDLFDEAVGRAVERVYADAVDDFPGAARTIALRARSP